MALKKWLRPESRRQDWIVGDAVSVSGARGSSPALVEAVLPVDFLADVPGAPDADLVRDELIADGVDRVLVLSFEVPGLGRMAAGVLRDRDGWRDLQGQRLTLRAVQ